MWSWLGAAWGEDCGVGLEAMPDLAAEGIAGGLVEGGCGRLVEGGLRGWLGAAGDAS